MNWDCILQQMDLVRVSLSDNATMPPTKKFQSQLTYSKSQTNTIITKLLKNESIMIHCMSSWLTSFTMTLNYMNGPKI